MRHLRFTIRGTEKGVFHTLLTMLCLFTILLLIASPSSSYESDHLINRQPNDLDNDGLPNLFENLIGTDPYHMDSDRDGMIDTLEYILHNDPLDRKDVATKSPGMRVAAYQQGNQAKLCMLFYPGGMHQLDSFEFLLAFDTQGTSVPKEIGRLNLTALIPIAVTEISCRVFKGEKLAAFIVPIPVSLIKEYAPISFGIRSNIEGDGYFDVVNLDVIDDQVVRLFSGAEVGYNPDEYYFSSLKNNPAGWSEEEVCKTELQLISSEDGVSRYKITDANCDSLLRQKCAPTQCAGQVGKEIISIDDGYLSGD